MPVPALAGGILSFALPKESIQKKSARCRLLPALLAFTRGCQKTPDPFATVQLYFFDGSFSHPVNQMVTSSDGRFLFTTDSQGQPLDAGTYVVFTSATDYQQGPAENLDITAGESRDIGDISLQPFIFIGSISGQAVDAVTHKPLVENIDSFTSVILYLCDDFFGCSQASIVNTDKEGRFQFNGTGSNTRLQAGSYSIGIFADQYESKQIDTFKVTLEGESRDLGDIPVQSFPVRFTNKASCKQAYMKSGICQYSVRIANGLATPLNGDAWSIVQGFGIGSPLRETTFQPNVIQRLVLKAGESKNVKFDFPLPNTVSDGAIICAKAFVGRRPIATWDTVGAADLFCITKGAIGFSFMPEKEVHKMRGRTFMPQKGR
jgi:5-hydroxyisourate hydrolase-like protein (transthyretin family)